MQVEDLQRYNELGDGYQLSEIIEEGGQVKLNGQVIRQVGG